jgi:hypothetical protein
MTREQLLNYARNVQAMIANPEVVHRIGKLASMPVTALQKGFPTFFWSVLGHAVPVPVQDEMERGDRINWARYVKVVALAKCNSTKPDEEVLSLASALRKSGFSKMRLDHLAEPVDSEDFRETLVRTASEMTRRGIAFSLDEMAELLLLEGPSHKDALEKFRRELDM